jgi:alanyl-tRNA synthetase
MTANDIRRKFLDFFASKDHKIVPSDSVVPKEDPTVLFTTAGMQQFKRQFLGQINGYTRAASSQKCLRTDDLDKVGKTPYHHTFFEMLGNFSFGDYFKKEAIAWAWEFLTQEMGIPPEKLWVSVYKDDTEAEAIWLKDVGIPRERLVRLGDKSNFWPAEAKEKGPNGPCGPCSEIFYDYGVNPDCPKGKMCDPDCDCGRFSEVWNLVFTQFNRKDGGVLEPLPAKNIDTGMGLERLVAVVQGKKSNYETDLFTSILDAISTNIKVPIGWDECLVIADHIRAIVFAISDGIIPSNKERGSIVRKLINKSTNFVINRGAKEPNVYKLVLSVVEVMKKQYPELEEKTEQIKSYIRKTEESFLLVREKYIPEFRKRIEESKNPEERGKLYFEFYDTYGLPITTIVDAVHQSGLKITAKEHAEALKHFKEHLENQKDRSRAASKMTGDVFADAQLNLNVPKTEFLGYTEKAGKAKILKIFVDTKEKDTAAKGDMVKIILDRTPFYAESGGQIGDTGLIKKEGASLRINDTQKIADVFIHLGTVEEGEFRLKDAVETRIDFERRLAIMRNHTATHLLQAALRKILGSHVQQQGSLVAEDRLRFDFTHPQAISKEQMAKIRDTINAWVNAGDPVQTKEMSIEEAQKSGALAFFAEKYGEKVRVISIGDYSKEFCGGTHLNNTKEIQRFEITKEGSVAQGIRRLEAKTGKSAEAFTAQQAQEAEAQRKALELKGSEAKARRSKLEEILQELIKNKLGKIENKNKPQVVVCMIKESVGNETLRELSDFVKQNFKSAAVVLGSGDGYVVATVTDDLVKQNIKANEIINEFNRITGGKGGGRPQFAQAGTKNPEKMPEAIKQAENFIQRQMSNLK